MKNVKLSNEEILLISQSITDYIERRLKLGFSSVVELDKYHDVCHSALAILDKLAEAVPNE